MTDNELIRSCDEAVQRERGALADVLRHLLEIDRRRLFSELNYKSLFDYCVRRLGYSEDQANRRINAMKLIKQMPEAEEKIEQGTLSLSNASLLQRMTTQSEKPLSRDEKLQLISKVENKSRREAEKILGNEKITYHLSVSETTDVKFQNLRGLTGHKYKNASELFDAMVDLALDEKHGLLPRKSSLAQKQRIMASSKAEIPISDAISFKASGFKDIQCTRCGSTHALQTEHIIPRAKGGTDELKNLTLLCRNCNQRAAIREFGQKKMDKFLNPQRL